MVEIGIPYQWDTIFKMNSIVVHDKLIQDTMPMLIIVPNKSTIPTTNKILNQLRPSTKTIMLLES